MKSKVYFVAVNGADNLQAVKSKLAQLLNKSKVLDCIHKKDKVAVKLHFGEEENTGFVRPEYTRVICDAIAKNGANCFVADTNTLYRGRRTNSEDHLRLAYEHGFTRDIVGTSVIIPDDTKKENTIDIPLNEKFIKVAKIAKVFVDADAIVDIAHFKGHMVTGFGGALKNLGMGCATREGKMAQHSDVCPVVSIESCVGCGECVKVCPVNAISIRREKADIDSSKCIGCATCIAACPAEAVDVNWNSGENVIQEKMIEYTKAVLKGKERKSAFLNFAVKITKECDCLAKDDPRIAPDVGIFASRDPVSIDKACTDLINQACGRDIFKQAHPKRDGTKQLKHASRLGLGNLDYDLIKL